MPSIQPHPGWGKARRHAISSPVVALQTREIADVSGKALQALTPQQTRAVNAYDPQGGIPFVLIAGRYAQIGAGFWPSLIVGLSSARIHTLIYNQPASTARRAVTREANKISALICSALGTNAQTTAACRISALRALLSKLDRVRVAALALRR
jgi:hypothetical protein